jgi:hypothetical protein
VPLLGHRSLIVQDSVTGDCTLGPAVLGFVRPQLLLSLKLIPLARNTIVDRRTLERERIREVGCAVSSGERVDGVPGLKRADPGRRRAGDGFMAALPPALLTPGKADAYRSTEESFHFSLSELRLLSEVGSIWCPAPGIR